MQFKPSDVGLPAYLDQWAGDQHILPQVTISGYTSSGPSGVPSYSHFRIYSLAANLTQIRGNHSMRGGIDTRMHFRTGGGGGNKSASFGFSDNYTRRDEDFFVPPGDIGLSLASFEIGVRESLV